MRNLCSIWLLTIYLCSTTQLGELLKLPILIEHFIEHRQQDPYFSLGSFLNMHYLADTVIDDDYSRDMELPFKTISPALTVAASFTLPDIDYSLALKPVVKIIKEEQPRYNVMLRSNYFNTIWQPPK